MKVGVFQLALTAVGLGKINARVLHGSATSVLWDLFFNDTADFLIM